MQEKENRRKDKTVDIPVIGIGGSLFDTFFVVPEMPAEDSKIRASDTLSQCGGPVATALTAVSRLGIRCAYIGAMGDDPAGKAMLSDFHAFGVATRAIIVREQCQSASSMILVNAARSTRTIVWSPGNAAPISPEELPDDLIAQAQVLHVDGLQPEAALSVARRFKESGKIVSLDAGSFHPGVDKLLELANWLVCAEDFVLRLTGASTAEDAVCQIFARYRPEVVAATQGKNGGIWTTDGKTVQHYEPAPVHEVDTTGAGDVFHGAVIYARLQGWDWPQVFPFASAVAALKCTKLGGRTGIPTRHEVDVYLQTQQGDPS